ncbi:MAG: hypothetical protein ABI969_17145 [bacterium]
MHTLLTSGLLATRLGAPVFAQEHKHTVVPGEKLGTVHFATSCGPAVATEFDRGLALLPSFEFISAIRSFTAALSSDSTCAMAQWGIALSRWTNPMTANLRSPDALEKGRQAAADASRLAPSATVESARTSQR